MERANISELHYVKTHTHKKEILNIFFFKETRIDLLINYFVI